MLNFPTDLLNSPPKDDRAAQLHSLRLQKLQEQKQAAEKMNEILAKLNDESRLTRRNLQAAIAVSKQPGYFEYHSPSPEVKQVEGNKVLSHLTRNVEKVNREIEQIDSEIDQLKAHKESKPVDLPMNSLHQWFDTYGRPKHADKSEMISTFHSSPKIYGGTGHHRAFKSQATIMKKGRVTF